MKCDMSMGTFNNWANSVVEKKYADKNNIAISLFTKAKVAQ